MNSMINYLSPIPVLGSVAITRRAGVIKATFHSSSFVCERNIFRSVTEDSVDDLDDFSAGCGGILCVSRVTGDSFVDRQVWSVAISNVKCVWIGVSGELWWGKRWQTKWNLFKCQSFHFHIWIRNKLEFLSSFDFMFSFYFHPIT